MTNRTTNLARRSAGVTLVETMVAVSILLIGVVTSLTLATYSIRLVSDSGKQLIASNLSREGLEVVRSMRDTNWLQGENWYYNLADPGDVVYVVPVFDAESGAWTLEEISAADATTCADPSNLTRCRLVLDDQGSGEEEMYLAYDAGATYTADQLTEYSRYLVLENDATTNRLLVRSVIHYQDKGRSFSVTSARELELAEILTDWRI